MWRDIAVTDAPLDEVGLSAALRDACPAAGAIAAFAGLVSPEGQGVTVEALELEHYPGMTETALVYILDDAAARWPLQGAVLWHRVGRMQPGEVIVFVAVASRHRDAAFTACRFIMDCLKTDVPFWKKEHSVQGEAWVDARESDAIARNHWNQPDQGDASK